MICFSQDGLSIFPLNKVILKIKDNSSFNEGVSIVADTIDGKLAIEVGVYKTISDAQRVLAMLNNDISADLKTFLFPPINYNA